MLSFQKLALSNFFSQIIGTTACTNQHGLPEIQGTMSCIRIQISSKGQGGNSAIVTFQAWYIYSTHVWPLSVPGSIHRGEMGWTRPKPCRIYVSCRITEQLACCNTENYSLPGAVVGSQEQTSREVSYITVNE